MNEWKKLNLTFALADSTSADPADAAFNSATAACQHERRLEEEMITSEYDIYVVSIYLMIPLGII